MMLLVPPASHGLPSPVILGGVLPPVILVKARIQQLARRASVVAGFPLALRLTARRGARA